MKEPTSEQPKHFIQVFIRSKSDLPAKSGIYFVFVRDDGEIVQWTYSKSSDNNNDDLDWLENIDWYLLPVPPSVSDEEIVQFSDLKVIGIATEDIETSHETIEKGDKVKGYLNNYHLLDCYSIQVEMQQESGGVGSGIVVMNVPVEKSSIKWVLSRTGNVREESDHPFAFVQSKCNGEINRCLKCGKDI
jgi:hypothetical protein